MHDYINLYVRAWITTGRTNGNWCLAGGGFRYVLLLLRIIIRLNIQKHRLYQSSTSFIASWFMIHVSWRMHSRQLTRESIRMDSRRSLFLSRYSTAARPGLLIMLIAWKLLHILYLFHFPNCICIGVCVCVFVHVCAQWTQQFIHLQLGQFVRPDVCVRCISGTRIIFHFPITMVGEQYGLLPCTIGPFFNSVLTRSMLWLSAELCLQYLLLGHMHNWLVAIAGDPHLLSVSEYDLLGTGRAHQQKQFPVWSFMICDSELWGR